MDLFIEFFFSKKNYYYRNLNGSLDILILKKPIKIYENYYLGIIKI
jgi:hypothetical protein